MKQLCKDILTAVFMGMILPGILLNGAVLWLNHSREMEAPPETTVPQAVSAPVPVRDAGGTVTQMDMDAYLTGVLLAEIPASFEPEAMKAQAVAARTYTRKAGVTGGKHGDGSICTEAACCQAYCSPEAFLARGGTEEAVDKVRKAVADTSGYVLTYGGELIEATYFSCSGGSTEDAAAVWGTEFPYLQAVESPGEEGADAFIQTVSFTPQQFQEALGVTLSGSPEDWFTITTYTQGGGVAAMTIGGTVYKGTHLRSLLGLRSTAFTVQAGKDQIAITTKGYGHRVGMSQYGADAMAVAGSSFEEILAHYYPGTLLCWVGD
nr:stage II sporulation protein D [Oscillospiraceae bacterium]